jgi:predicted amino acid-binding ACT domain protein
MTAARNLAVVSVIGRDQKGVVARICTYLAGNNINIEDIEQRVVEGLFIMTMLVDLADVTVTLDELVLGLKEIGVEMHLEVSVRLHGERVRKRIAVLVSREPHCLQQLLADRAAGLIAGEFACVLSNHEVLRPIAEAAGIPFEWLPSTDKAAHMAFLLERLRAHKPDLVVLARYMQVVTPELSSSSATASSTSTRHCCRTTRAPTPISRPSKRGAGLGLHRPFRDRAPRPGPGGAAGRVPHPRRRGYAGRRPHRAARSSRARCCRRPCSSSQRTSSW